MTLNRKGQSLVLFILLLPILIGIMALVIDIGRVIIEKNKIDNTIEMVLEISLEDKLKTSEIHNLINQNLQESQNKVTRENNTLTIESNKEIKGIFSNVLGFNKFKIISKYTATEQQNKPIIKKEK